MGPWDMWYRYYFTTGYCELTVIKLNTLRPILTALPQEPLLGLHFQKAPKVMVVAYIPVPNSTVTYCIQIMLTEAAAVFTMTPRG
jgi:hypothetical protein